MSTRFRFLTQVQYLEGENPVFFAVSPYLPTRGFPKPL